jgi:hypothetical protein
VTLEEEYFPPPPELRELLRGLAGALSLLNRVPSPDPERGGPDPADPVDPATRVLAEDRTTAAADVLERLAG